MSVLRSIESKLEALFEGVFGRAFRSNVQPVELARKLVKEMDDHRSVSVSRVYVPNEYTVYLSPADLEQFANYESQLLDELSDYLAEHARRENYVLLTPPQVHLASDEDLDVGVFGIATRMARSSEAKNGEPADEAAPGATMIYVPTPQATEAAAPVDLGIEREVAVLRWGDTRHELAKPRVVIGRSKDADVRIDDPNVSRRHAEVQHDGATYWLVDLDSTNGVEVHGKRVKRLKLEDGTRFTIGSTEIAFSRELQ
jgi:pSer/pThr/pTyr-binding forkhead associated (FHA) protein